MREIRVSPVKPCGQRQANVLTGWIGRNRIAGLLMKSDALPNFNTDRHSSKLRHGSRTHSVSSNGNTWQRKAVSHGGSRCVIDARACKRFHRDSPEASSTWRGRDDANRRAPARTAACRAPRRARRAAGPRNSRSVSARRSPRNRSASRHHFNKQYNTVRDDVRLKRRRAQGRQQKNTIPERRTVSLRLLSPAVLRYSIGRVVCCFVAS